MPQPLQITIESTADGYLRWEIFYGPERTLHFAGTAPLLERVFEDLIRTQWVLAENLTGEADSVPLVDAYGGLHLASPAQIHTPPGASLPAQQDIPPTRHTH